MFVRVVVLGFCLCFPMSLWAEVGVTDKEILIGASGSYTGPNSVNAINIRDGAVRYYEKINAAGGVHGRKIKYVALDDSYDPKKSKENLEDLVLKQKVFAIVGGNGGAGVATVLPLLERDKVPLLFPFAYNDFMYSNKRTIFALSAPLALQTHELISYVVKDLKQKKFGTFYQDDSSATAVRDGFHKSLAEFGIAPIRSTSYTRIATDFTRNVDELQKAGVEVVLLGSNTTQSVAFIEVAQKRGYKPVYITSAGTALPLLTSTTATAFAIEPVPLMIHDDWAIIKEFKKDIEGMNLASENRAFFGYLGARIFVEGLRKAGKDLTREKLITALESFASLDLGGVKTNLTKSKHSALSKGFLYHLEKGKIKSLK